MQNDYFLKSINRVLPKMQNDDFFSIEFLSMQILDKYIVIYVHKSQNFAES